VVFSKNVLTATIVGNGTVHIVMGVRGRDSLYLESIPALIVVILENGTVHTVKLLPVSSMKLFLKLS
jgi:hypothetical protein